MTDGQPTIARSVTLEAPALAASCGKRLVRMSEGPRRQRPSLSKDGRVPRGCLSARRDGEFVFQMFTAASF
jgi:hypothetical protein